MKEEILIVDGYNMIGAWPELASLKDVRLEEARDRLIDILTDYQGFSGYRILLVFDAHQVPGLGAQYKQNKLEIIYTREKETADECIERLVTGLISRRRTIYVATNDSVEQHVIFAKGAFRKTSRELLLDIAESRKLLKEKIRETKAETRSARNTFDSKLSGEMRSLFERWRRGDK